MADALTGWLQGRRVLVIVDNCEHVLDAAAALVEKVAAGCETVTILATSTLAQRHFQQALLLAKASNEPALPGLVYGSLSHLALETRRPQEAIAFARAGQEAITCAFHPSLTARLHAMEARGLAATGDERNSIPSGPGPPPAGHALR
jgi:predicted ATPase